MRNRRILDDPDEVAAEAQRKGGGEPYSEFENFQALMGAMSGQSFGATLIVRGPSPPAPLPWGEG